jgi:hypothetical protein
VVLGVALAAAVVGCKKDNGAPGKLPSELTPKPANVDTSKLAAPPLFAHIPADTPYVVASFEAFPIEYWRRMKKAIGPAFENAFRKKRYASSSDGEGTKVLDAVIAELDGKWNAAGFESLGLSAQPRFALYGIGLLPVVARLEVKDDKTVLATIQRIAQKAGATLPEQQTLGNRSYWRFDEKDDAVIISLGDNQIVFAVGTAARIEATLPQILGTEKPAQSMADGKLLKDVMTKHGFGPYMVGYSDTKKLAAAVAAFLGKDMPAECTAAIDKVASSVPGIAFGYNEINAKRASGGAVLELASDLRGEIKALETEVPGLVEAMQGDPLFAMGGGVDLAKAQKLGQRAANVVRELGEGCHSMKISIAAEEMALAMAKPLPEPFDQITGGVMALSTLEMSGGGMPDKVDAVGMVTATSGKKLFDAMSGQVRELKKLGIEADGSLHKLDVPLPMPFDIYAGVGDHALVLAAGDKGKHLADKAMSAQGGGKVPLLVASYDYGEVVKLQAKLGRMAGGDKDSAALDEMAKALGRASFSVDINDQGLVMWGDIEMK